MASTHDLKTTNLTMFDDAYTTELVMTIPERFPNDLDLFIGYFRAYVIGALIVFGLIGNGMSAVVFYRRRNKEDGWILYLFWLAISDTGCLLSTGLPEWTSHGLYFATEEWVYLPLLTLSEISCRALRYIWNISFHNSTLIITTFSLEKCIVIWNPLKRSTLITRRRRKAALTCIFITSLIMWITAPITHEVVDDNSPMKVCVYDLTKLPLWLIIIFMTEVHLVYTLPSFIIMLSGLFLIIGIQRSRDAVKTSTNGGTKTRRAETRCLMNLIALTINFLIFIGPNVIAWCIYIVQFYTYGTAEPDVVSVAWLTTSLVQGNFSLNVVLYMCFLPFFREELSETICGQCKRIKTLDTTSISI